MGIRGPLVCLFCFAYLVGLAGSIPINDHRALLAPGAILSIFGLFTFLYNGRKTIVATSVISYSVVMFIGFPAVYAGLGQYWSYQVESPLSVLVVITLGFVLQVATLVAAPRVPAPKVAAYPPGDSKGLSKGWLTLALGMMALALGSWFIGVPLVPSALAWIAVLFATLVAFDVSARRIRPSGVIVLALVTIGYLEITFGGFGRLNLAVLGMSAAIVATVGLRTWWVKISAVAVTAPALVYLANQRVNFLRHDVGRDAADSEGIASVVGPLFSAGRIVEVYLDGRLDPAFGSTAITAALAWIPRAFWPSKPEGFGREMVEITRPALVSTEEFSDAATFVGESVWNFGVWGAPLMLIGAAVVARAADKALLGYDIKTGNPCSIILFLIIVILSASMLNVIWGGLFTAASRMFVALAILSGLWVILRHREALSGNR